MSRISEFRAAENELKRQLALLDQMKEDQSLQRELEFEEKLKALMDEYDVSLTALRQILDPDYRPTANQSSAKESGKRKPRQLKVYVNPHDGSVIETKGGNHKVLKEWKAKWGSEEVEGWLKAE